MAKIIVNYDKFVTIPVVERIPQDTTFQAYNRHVLAQITLFLMVFNDADLIVDKFDRS